MNLKALSFVEQNEKLFNPNDEGFRVHFYFKKALDLGIMEAKMNLEWITRVIHEIEEGGLDKGV